jgi:hypothetical protein
VIEDGNMIFEIQNRLKETDKTTNKMAGKVDDIHEWLKPKENHSAPEHVLEEMPTIRRLRGRDGVIKDIVDLITIDSSPRVGILGAGGMGKTSVAIAVMNHEAIAEKYDETHRFWIPCIGVTSPLSFVQILAVSLRISNVADPSLTDITNALNSSTKPRLLLLDNLETVMNLPEVARDSSGLSSEQILDRLAGIPHVSLLVTIRSNKLPSQHIDWKLFPLHGVAQADARTIFTGIYPQAEDDPSLDPLLEVLGCLPYAVTLMAKHAATLGDIDLKRLLDAWLKNGLNSLSDDLK